MVNRSYLDILETGLAVAATVKLEGDLPLPAAGRIKQLHDVFWLGL